MTRHERRMWRETILSGVATMVLISIMGWLCLTWPEPQPAPFLQADKGEVIRLQPAAMAEATARFNAALDRRCEK